jgi:hypothetical protein
LWKREEEERREGREVGEEDRREESEIPKIRETCKNVQMRQKSDHRLERGTG